MLPNSGNHQSPLPEGKTNTFLIIVPKNPFTSIKSQSALRLLGWLVLAVLIQSLIAVFLIRNSARSPPPFPSKSFPGFRDKGCENGKVFVYDLPPSFNKRLLENCHDLDPWKSMCPMLSNGGFGPKANNLDGVVPGNILPAWYRTDLYSAEVIYHVRMVNYRCRTLNSKEATAFYVPFYAGLAIEKYLWYNYTAKDRDRPCETMLDWVKNQPFWKKHDGDDHFLMLGRLTWAFRRPKNKDSEWGSSFLSMPLMKNVLKLSVERNPWDELEFSVPWPSAFHPRSKSDIIECQSYVRARRRSSLFTFVGATRKKIKNDFRGLLMDHCKSQPGSCRVVDCSVTRCLDGAPEILEAFLDSDFCLQPRGDGYTRKSFLDCMVAGSIPVFFWEKSFKGQYEWHLPAKAESYSVFIDHKDVRNGTVSIRSKLEEFSREEVRKMRETVIELLPRIVYAESSQGLGDPKDAFDITIENVLMKFNLDLSKKKNQSS